MGHGPIRLLLLESDPAHAALTRRALAEAGEARFAVEVGDRLSTGLKRLAEREFDVVVSALRLAHGLGLEMLRRVRAAAPEIPIVVLASVSEEALAIEAVGQGAQDYLVKSQSDGRQLARTIRHVAERSRLLRELAEQRRALASSEARLHHLIEAGPDGVIIIDGEGVVRLVSPAAEQALERTAQELLDARVGTPLPQSDPVEVEFARRTGGCVVELRVVETEWDRQPASMVLLCDLTELRRTQAELDEARELERRLTHHDPLTALPNRNLLYDRLDQALAEARRINQRVALLVFDLDEFKNVNDSLGHRAGDLLIQGVAQRLTCCIRESDTLARIGGDEFTAMLKGITHAQDAMRVARKLLGAFAAPFEVLGHEIFITASIGIGLYPDDATDVGGLLKCAEIAMYRAKGLGRNNCQLYNVSMDAAAAQRLALENGLRKAIGRDEMSLHYQPLVDLASGAIGCVEALLRWQHPEFGSVAPATFIPVAEETGLIVPIGEWVLRSALEQARTWALAGLPPVRVAVNLSARQFHEQGLPQAFGKAIRDTGADPRRLVLEITESGAIQDIDHTRQTLHVFKEIGARVSIDDFGTGYSSLSHLKRLPIDTLKIDPSFISGVPADRDDAVITSAIITLGHSMGLTVVGEGVETTEQRDFLRSRGCDAMQGFLFSPPVPADAMAHILRQDGGTQGQLVPA